MAEKKNVQIIPSDTFAKDAERGVFGAFLFFGEEDFVKERALAKLRSQILTAEGFEPFNHFDISFSGASNMTREELFSSLYDAVDAMPMMQEQKFIEIHDIAIDKAPAADIDALVSACKKAGEDTVLVIFCRDSELQCDYRFEQGANFVKIAAAATPVRFGLMTKARLTSYARRELVKEDVKISDGALDVLADMCACRMMALTGELSKIAAYAEISGKDKEITEETVRRICSVSAADEVPFALTDAMQKWTVGGMLAAIAQSKDMREEPIAVVSKMGRTYTDMLLIKSAMMSGLSSADISKKLRMNAYRVDKYVQSLVRVPISVIENALEELYALDLKLKSTQSDPWMLVDLFISKVYMPRSMR